MRLPFIGRFLVFNFAFADMVTGNVGRQCLHVNTMQQQLQVIFLQVEVDAQVPPVLGDKLNGLPSSESLFG